MRWGYNGVVVQHATVALEKSVLLLEICTPSRKFFFWFDPASKMDTGTAYLCDAEQRLSGGIDNPTSLLCAVITASNVGGAGSAARVFSLADKIQWPTYY